MPPVCPCFQTQVGAAVGQKGGAFALDAPLLGAPCDFKIHTYSVLGLFDIYSFCVREIKQKFLTT